jgi:hypothetical protein
MSRIALMLVCLLQACLPIVSIAAPPPGNDDLLLLILPSITTYSRHKTLKSAPGKPQGPAVSRTIGAAGGTVTSADGRVVLNVPAGALAHNTVLTVTKVTSPAANALGNYLFEPQGTTFLTPVTLTFNVPEAGNAASSIEALGVAMRKDNGKWQWIKVNRNSGSKTLSIRTTHFSEYSSVPGIWLIPSDARARVTTTVKMTVGFCGNPDSNSGDLAPLTNDPDPLAQLVFECYPFPMGVMPRYANAVWSVNGIAGGNSTYGTIEPTSTKSYATFTAPDSRPAPAEVQVSVSNFKFGPAGETVIYVGATVTITERRDYEGTFTFSGTMDEMGTPQFVSGHGSTTWKYTSYDEDAQVTTYEANDTKIYLDQTQFSVSPDEVIVLDSHEPGIHDVDASVIFDEGKLWWLFQGIWSGRLYYQGNLLYSSDHMGLVQWNICHSRDGSDIQVDPTVFPARLVGSFTSCTEDGGGSAIKVDFDLREKKYGY